ncbi:hypothetical protein V6257_20965, partial [Pseudoalteromonas issachenkonii]
FSLRNHVFTNDFPTKSLIGKRIFYLEPHEHTHDAVLSLLTQWEANVTACFNETSFLDAIKYSELKYDVCLI